MTKENNSQNKSIFFKYNNFIILEENKKKIMDKMDIFSFFYNDEFGEF